MIPNRHVTDGIGAHASFMRRALIHTGQAEHIGSAPLHPAQVVGMIDNARQISVFEVDAHPQPVLSPNETTFNCHVWIIAIHDPALAERPGQRNPGTAHVPRDGAGRKGSAS